MHLTIELKSIKIIKKKKNMEFIVKMFLGNAQYCWQTCKSGRLVPCRG